MTDKEIKQARWAICGECHKYHKEGSKIQIEHAKLGYMGTGEIRWYTENPTNMYYGGSSRR